MRRKEAGNPIAPFLGRKFGVDFGVTLDQKR